MDKRDKSEDGDDGEGGVSVGRPPVGFDIDAWNATRELPRTNRQNARPKARAAKAALHEPPGTFLHNIAETKLKVSEQLRNFNGSG